MHRGSGRVVDTRDVSLPRPFSRQRRPSPLRTTRSTHGGSRGQALAETAIVVPLLLVLCVGVIDGGRAYSYAESVSNADRQVLRVVDTQESVGDAACSGVGAVATTKTQTAHVPWQAGDTLPSWVVTAAQVESTDTSGNTRIGGALVTVTFHCLSGKAITNATATTNDPAQAASDSVEVSVCYPFSFITPLASRLFGNRNCPTMSGSGTVTITEDQSGRAEY